MQILLILMVVAVLWFPAEPMLGWGAAWSAGLTALSVLFGWLSAEATGEWFLWRLRRRPGRRGQLLRAYGRFRALHLGLTMGLFLASLILADWNYTVRREWGLMHGVLLDELLVLAPLVASLCLGWVSFFRVERGFYDSSMGAEAIPFWTRGAYVLFHVRHQLGLVLVPILVFTGLHELAQYLFPQWKHTDWFQFSVLGFLGVMILVVTPWLLTLIWSARSLPAGPLRDRLDAAGRRLRFRCTDILLWNTRGGMANAMVTGLLPFPRYVLLSDSLIQNLTPAEVEGVFGHEIGHIRHHHMPLYLVFFFLSMALLTGSAALLDRLFNLGAENIDLSWRLIVGSQAVEWGTSALGMLLLVGGYIYLVFGFLSRRCERQADVYGAKVASCGQSLCSGEHNSQEATTNTTLTLCPAGIRTFITALEKVADLNGIRRDKPSWRHASIARRVAFLERLLDHPDEEPRFQRRLLIMKCGLLVALIALVGWLWYPAFAAEAPLP